LKKGSLSAYPEFLKLEDHSKERFSKLSALLSKECNSCTSVEEASTVWGLRYELQAYTFETKLSEEYVTKAKLREEYVTKDGMTNAVKACKACSALQSKVNAFE
jgi:hypothetical protein